MLPDLGTDCIQIWQYNKPIKESVMKLVNSPAFRRLVKQYSRKLWAHLHQVVYVVAMILFSIQVLGQNSKFYANEYWGTVVPLAVMLGGVYSLFVIMAVQIRLSVDKTDPALVGRVYVAAGLISVMLIAGFAEARTAGVGWMVFGLIGIVAMAIDYGVHEFIKWAKTRRQQDLPVLRFWVMG